MTAATREGISISNPYTTVAVSGYNSSPPADDGSQVASNQVTWAKSKEKLGDPLKTALESINTNVNAAFATVDDASNLTTGTLPDGRFPATLPAASGANLTALNASNLASGTVPDGRFPATLPAASGANLTALNGSNVSSGTVDDARLSSQVCLKDTAITGADGANAADPGYRGLPLSSQTEDYTVATTDNGIGIIASSNCDEVTLTSASLPDGGMVTIYNSLAASAALTIVQGSGATLYLAGAGTTGNRTVSGVGACFAVAVHIGGGTYIVSGAGVS